MGNKNSTTIDDICCEYFSSISRLIIVCISRYFISNTKDIGQKESITIGSYKYIHYVGTSEQSDNKDNDLITFSLRDWKK